MSKVSSLVVALVLVPAAVSAQTAAPAPIVSVSGGLDLALPGENAASLLAGVVRLTWTPLSFLGLTGEAHLDSIVPMFPFGWRAGARVGALLKWPPGGGQLSPFVGAQVGLIGLGFVEPGEDGPSHAGIVGREVRLEAGLDIPLLEVPHPGTSRPNQFFSH